MTRLAFAGLPVLLLAGFSAAQQAVEPVVLRDHRQGVTSVAFSPDGRLLASTDLAGVILIRRTGSWEPIRRLRHGSEVYAVAFSPDGRRLATTGGDDRVIIWMVATGHVERTLPFPDRALALAFAPNGDLLVGGQGGELRIVRLTDGTIQRRIATQTSIWSVAVSPDGGVAATTGPLRLWDLATGARVAGPSSYGLLGVVYAPDGKLIMTGEPVGGASILSLDPPGRRDTLHLWEQKPMPGRAGNDQVSVDMPASAVALSQRGNYAAAGGSDRIVHLWPLLPSKADEANHQRLLGHTMSVTAVAFSPDGKWLVSGSLDRTVRVWALR